VALESFEKYMRHGIRLAMGTDCYPADMIISMRLGTFMCRFAENSPFVCSTADIYRAATLGGAKALMRDDLGRLAPGAKADIIVIDLDSFHIAQVDDPIRTVILNGFGRDVTTVFIDGKLVLQDRQIPGVDYSQLRTGAQKFYDQMKLGYSERDYLHRNLDELFPPGFKFVERRNHT
jgi:cytosine/adenosine deaminase-related metal-dependent hydrolase